MEFQQLLRRPAAGCLSLLSSSSAASLLPLASSRHMSTRRRTKKALNIPPHPSFLDPSSPSSIKARGGATPSLPGVDTIIINPPSSAPSVYHTPFKFLPKEDPRRRANLASLFTAARNASTTIAYNDPNVYALKAAAAAAAAATGSANAGGDAAAAGVQPGPQRKRLAYHLTEADVAQMRSLRAEDPVKNSVVKLANRFRCSRKFVLMCCQTSPEHYAKQNAQQMAFISRWGPRRQAAREERQRRKEMLERGEI